METIRNRNFNEGRRIVDDNSAIRTTTEDRDKVRSRPQIYFGRVNVEGCSHGTFELITNGVDEVREGYGDTIYTEVAEDYTITVTDNGRGVPMGWNPADGRYNWDCVYNKLQSSGKGAQGAYAEAAGLNGVGASITQFTALWMKVISRRIEREFDEEENVIGETPVEYEMNFEDGYPKGELITREWTGEHTGTIITYQADPSIFQDTAVTPDLFLDKLRKLAVITPGCHFQFKYKDSGIVDFYFEDGAETFLKETCPDMITKDIISLHNVSQARELRAGDVAEFNVTADIAFTFSYKNAFVETFHNGAYLVDNGTHFDGFRQAVKTVIEDYAKRTGKMEKNDKITFGDIDETLVCIVASRFNGDYSNFDGQDKRAILNNSLTGIFNSITKEGFVEWSTLHREEMDKIVDAVLTFKNAREKAESVKKNVLKKLTTNISSFKNRPDKLDDCKSKNVMENELYIVEGDSAKGSVVLARDVRFQAAFPLTGKILNCLKAPIEEILNNAVIINLCQIVGCGIEVQSKYIKDMPKFDLSKLNYGKIIISTDADIDGSHIQCLLMIFFYRMMPTLLKTGHVYIAEAPLYRIHDKTTSVYAYSDAEKDQLVAELKKEGHKMLNVSRFKGLGEMSAEQMAESTMNPLTRRLTPVEFPKDEEEFARIANELLGNDIEARREWMNDFFDYEEQQEEAI